MRPASELLPRKTGSQLFPNSALTGLAFHFLRFLAWYQAVSQPQRGAEFASIAVPSRVVLA
jgi:hypothetical protein